MKVQEKDLLAYDWGPVTHWYSGVKKTVGFDAAVDGEIGERYMYNYPAISGAARLTFSSRKVRR